MQHKREQTEDPVTQAEQTHDAVTARFDLQLFNEGGSGDGGDGSGAGGSGDSGAKGGAGDKNDGKSDMVTKAYADTLKREAEQRRKAHEADLAELEKLRQEKETREKKELEDRGEVQKLLERERKEREAERKQYESKEKERTQREILREARAAAKDAGMIDLDDVKSLDLSDFRIDEDGNVPGLEAAIAAFKEKKPHYFRAAGDKSKGEGDKGRVIARPGAKDDANSGSGGSDKGGTNWSSAKESDVRAHLKKYGVNV